MLLTKYLPAYIIIIYYKHIVYKIQIVNIPQQLKFFLKNIGTYYAGNFVHQIYLLMINLVLSMTL